MDRKVYGQLSLMMFLQFFLWGSWFVTLGTYLGSNLSATGAQTGMAFSTQSWGAIIAPFIIGLIADRYFNAEKILGILHLIGGVLMLLMANASDFAAFYPCILAYMILYMPTLALVNSVSFRQMQDPARQFGQIRVWGTAGWILAGLVISFGFAWDSSEAVQQGMLKNTFMMAAIASFAMGIFSFTLPATPPVTSTGKVSLGQILGLETLTMLKDRNYFVFFFSSVLICIPLAFYYQHANPFLSAIGVENPTGIMTFGQVSEVLFMLLLPVFILRFGIKITLLAGMLAWALRYLAFAYGDPGNSMYLLFIGIALHGVCYDFFFVSGQIYTDKKAGEQYKSAAQGLITLATYGVGMLIGYWAAGKLYDANALAEGYDWHAIWMFPAIFALAVFVIFAFAFKDNSPGEKG